MHPIEGLVLHQVAYDDDGRTRPIAHRLSISEMVVPYGSNDPFHHWKNAFDCGEWGLGRMVNSLELGCDCLGEIRYFDAAVADERGNARIQPNVIRVHAEDFGILWKHQDLHSFTTETRRSRRLVVSSIHTVGNYEYGFYWYF
jgi:primary-amine oxidase